MIVIMDMSSGERIEDDARDERPEDIRPTEHMLLPTPRLELQESVANLPGRRFNSLWCGLAPATVQAAPGPTRH